MFSFQKNTLLYLFLVSFAFSFICQVFVWRYDYMLDVGMWANQGQYFALGDNRQYDIKVAYGHPGGPIVLGVAFLGHYLGAPYNINTIAYVMAFLNSIAIAGISIICYLMREKYWWFVATGLLSINHLYFHATPPSALASLLATFLCLLTLYLSNKNRIEIKQLEVLLWGFLSGVLVATRTDIGLFMSLVFGLFILNKITWRGGLFVFASALVSFVVFNPFMWRIPFLHIQDLLFKATYHYFDFRASPVDLGMLFGVSHLALLSIGLFVLAWFSRKKFTEGLPLNFKFGWLLVGLTVFLCLVFLTSKYQAIRYFIPIIFIWEVFLPVLLFAWIRVLSFSDNLKNLINLFLAFALAFYYISEYWFRFS